ncbi:hypothetical protein F5884DRAFT_498640 [Xylogone sp. PMI_703]|nr:hypothetical protein F5884DRAFT_498640 [Xylogone sp. PMI_703]
MADNDKSSGEQEFHANPGNAIRENQGNQKGGSVAARAHEANPGPVIPDNMNNVQQEGSKEERRAKAQALNK